MCFETRKHTVQSLVDALVIVLIAAVNSGHLAVCIVGDVVNPSCHRHLAAYPSFSNPSLQQTKDALQTQICSNRRWAGHLSLNPDGDHTTVN